MNRFAAGALGGLFATVPMTVAMTKLFSRLPSSEQYPLPPREITEILVNRLPGGKYLSDEQLTFLSLLAHFAYGAATGALYPLLCQRPKHPLLTGNLFGFTVWAASYLGWLPATNILRPATQHPPARNMLMLAAHSIWGMSTVVIGEILKSREGLRCTYLRQSPDLRQSPERNCVN